MKKLSLSKIIRRRKMVRIVSIFAFLVLLFAFSSFFLSKNAGTTKAATTCGSGSITISDNASINNSAFVLAGSACNGLNLSTYDVTIDGNYTVTVSGSNTFKSLTLKNNSKITHEALAIGENGSTSSKKIEITVTNQLIVENGSTIDASGKGYRSNEGPSKGANVVNEEGDSMNYGGGGGGNGGKGGNGYNSETDPNDWNSLIETAVSGGSARADAVASEHGSGGGKAIYNDTWSGFEYVKAQGGAGGGLIRITADTVNLSGPNAIVANGSDGQSHRYDAMFTLDTWYHDGGGGSGGSIELTTNVLYCDKGTSLNLDGGTTGPLKTATLPESGSSDNPQFEPTSSYNTNDFGSFISANGGDSTMVGGGGGAGRIILDLGDVVDTCILGAGRDLIPDVCENRNVVLDGNVTIYADKVKIWQSGPNQGEECNDPADVSCDSKRHFNSLTIKNGATLTHQALNAAEVIADDSDGDFSVADEDVGTARWKKVDLVVANNIELQSGGKIDVSEKGYPGGSSDVYDSAVDGYGPGRGVHYVHVAHHEDKTSASGAGYGGGGGDGSSFNGCNHICPPYYRGGLAYNYDSFDFGSGGGEAYSRDIDHGGMRGHGGAGGGRIRLSSNSIIFSDPLSSISANGESLTQSGGDEVYAIGGGGSGGLILIITDDIQYKDFTPSSAASANHGFNYPYNDARLSSSEDGRIIANVNIYNIFSNGGSLSNVHEWGTGSGGGGWIVLNPTDSKASIKKYLEPVRRNGNTGSPDCNVSSPGTNPNCFNPYAVQIGDVIRVNIIVTNASVGLSIPVKDVPFEVLNSTVKARCSPINSNNLPPGSSISEFNNSEVSWNYVPTSTGDSSLFSYICQVETY